MKIYVCKDVFCQGKQLPIKMFVYVMIIKAGTGNAMESCDNFHAASQIQTTKEALGSLRSDDGNVNDNATNQ